MKSIFLGLFCLLRMTQLFTQTLHPDDATSQVLFTIKNFGINTTGSLNGLQGDIIINEQDCSKDYFHVSVSASSVNTGISARDHHLRSNDYFNVATFPDIQFISESVYQNKSDGTCWVTGKLTIKAVSQFIKFPFTVVRTSNGYRLKGAFFINRLDYGVGSSSWVLANTVLVQLNVLAVQ
ncbi:MAG: polyisoprenoid-binding protein [Hydrotalea sp. AMD]|uniref:YceI family protein n=1 Tax=Hydrotalea sp. AMD TaxID=2501297 RepID=UPI0009BDA4DA|nr:YceI family protein [Hydrotalea sp. AMD]RWZ87738.1 MAG: polyisoprenoid-binding protein [Hydrotalea sp. AMD]